MAMSCDDIARYSDKIQYEEASFWEKLRLKIHLAYCKGCKQYNENNSLLTKLFKKEDYKVLDTKDLQDINEILDKSLKDSQGIH